MRIPLWCVLFIVFLPACNSLALSAYPGYQGTQKASNVTPVGHQYFFSSADEAKEYLSRFTRFQVEGPEQISIGEPIFTIVNVSVNGAYRDSHLEAEVPLTVSPSATAGTYSYRIMMYDNTDTLLLTVEGSIIVDASHDDSDRRNGLITLGIGIVVFLFGLYIYRSDEEFSTIGGLLAMALGVVIAISGILWFFRIVTNP